MQFHRFWRRYNKSVLALLLCGATFTSAQAIEFMKVEDLHRGMVGHADTVVQGDRIDSFQVEVLGVMKQRGPSGDLILVKVSGPVIDASGGIVHGMSGSPVYIDGKLVGAVAYGWGFTDGTLGMLTPIDQMVKLWDEKYQKDLPNPWKDNQLIPLGTPLMADGYDEASLSYLGTKFKDFGYKGYATASDSTDDIVKPMVPGGSIAALLVKGDLKMGAVGTVTYVDKDKVVAFGHPFDKRGSTGYFMNNSSIFTVVKSIDSGFKLGSLGREVGVITEDRGAGIAGTVGVFGKGVPVRMQLRDLDRGVERNAAVTVVESSKLTPTLVATSVYSLLNKTLDRVGGGTAKINIKITPVDPKLPTLERRNMVYSSSSVSEKSIDELFDIVESLMNNAFKDYEIRDIQVDVQVEEAKRTATIIDASADQVIVSPGDNIVITANLQAYREGKIQREIIFKVPEDQKLGTYTLEVRGGGVIPLPYLFEKQKYNLTDEIVERLKVHKNFDEYFKDLSEDDQNNQIVAEFLADDISMVEESGDKAKKQRLEADEEDVDDDELPNGGKHKKGLKASDDDEKENNEASRVVVDYVVLGDGQFTVQVVDKKDRDHLRKQRIKEKLSNLKEKVKAEESDQKKNK
ncbi:SpoIVB peptidase S55 domain-containing protein [Veillonella sp. CNR 79/14]|uniref:SpoIVB peptidase S55 domain-containing protein n=1 Tax=Veillonella sp. CNR 79/14 TaxID=2490954 RepID=UPI000F8E44FD|nr:SpoIVB peptidase S55 domain-containing protein [Veillonella sp. CNR 79/14]